MSAGRIVRCFFCVDLSSEAVRILEDWAAKRGKRSAAFGGFRWTKSDTYHVTLKFCGEINEPDAQAMFADFSASRKQPLAIACALGNLGVFPNARSPRVLWMGVDDGGALSSLAALADSAASKIGVPSESGKTFTPHVTLARAKRDAASPDRALLETALANESREINGAPHRWTIDSVILMESTLRPEGPVYKPLYIYRP